MPDGTLLITPPENLSIYWQRGSRRRYLRDEPKRKRVENYESSNDATSWKTSAPAAWSRTSSWATGPAPKED